MVLFLALARRKHWIRSVGSSSFSPNSAKTRKRCRISGWLCATWIANSSIICLQRHAFAQANFISNKPTTNSFIPLDLIVLCSYRFTLCFPIFRFKLSFRNCTPSEVKWSVIQNDSPLVCIENCTISHVSHLQWFAMAIWSREKSLNRRDSIIESRSHVFIARSFSFRICVFVSYANSKYCVYSSVVDRMASLGYFWLIRFTIIISPVLLFVVVSPHV